MTDVLTIGNFAPHLDIRFVIAQPENYELELTEVIDSSNAQLEQFSLIFTGTVSPCIRQGIYTLVHQEIGKCELFPVPLGPDAVGMRYIRGGNSIRHTLEGPYFPNRRMGRKMGINLRLIP